MKESEVRKHLWSSIEGLTTQNFITSLSTEDHLDAHGLDLPAEEVHRRASTDRRDIVSLKMVDNLG